MLGDYTPILEAINYLDDPEFFYPVFPFGYDWRFELGTPGGELGTPAGELVKKINEVLAVKEYPDFGERGAKKDYDKIHSKVIIVTHSQGGVVARYAANESAPTAISSHSVFTADLLKLRDQIV